VELALKGVEGISADAIRFTDRERQVVNLIAQGLSNKEIAESLHIATYTVKSHVHNVLEKMELSTRLQVAAFVHKEGPV
jgi:DNA-binding NarL/FixJ family response regulator